MDAALSSLGAALTSCAGCFRPAREEEWRLAVEFDFAYQDQVIYSPSFYELAPEQQLEALQPAPPTPITPNPDWQLRSTVPPPPTNMAENPLVSKSADSGLQVALHPLVLLTISDYITRHTLRQQVGPVVGALLGQQNGREITIEHAFECLLVELDGEVVLSQAWFEDRLQQMKDVHKAPALDLVGWYTVMPTNGPQPEHLPIHRQILSTYNESAILLGFHPAEVLEGSSGGKLPLTIFESNYEADDTVGDSGEDKEMKDGETQLGLRFKELPYSVETGEAEMISVDFVARGGGNATAIENTSSKKSTPDKGKQKAEATDRGFGKDVAKTEEHSYLTREEEELIATLTAKANAVKMLQTRINLIATYLQNLPPSFISDSVLEGEEDDSKRYTPVNHSILRSIQALLTRLSLLIPADAAAFEQELLSEQNDVEMVRLLSSLTQSVKDVRETGRKFSIVEQGRASKAGPKQDPRFGWDDASGGNQVMGVGDLIT